MPTFLDRKHPGHRGRIRLELDGGQLGLVLDDEGLLVLDGRAALGKSQLVVSQPRLERVHGEVVQDEGVGAEGGVGVGVARVGRRVQQAGFESEED